MYHLLNQNRHNRRRNRNYNSTVTTTSTTTNQSSSNGVFSSNNTSNDVTITSPTTAPGAASSSNHQLMELEVAKPSYQVPLSNTSNISTDNRYENLERPVIVQVEKSKEKKKSGPKLANACSLPVTYVCILITGLTLVVSASILFLIALSQAALVLSLSGINYKNEELYPERKVGMTVSICLGCVMLLLTFVGYFFCTWWANSAKTTRTIHPAYYKQSFVDTHPNEEGMELCIAPDKWLYNE